MFATEATPNIFTIPFSNKEAEVDELQRMILEKLHEIEERQVKNYEEIIRLKSILDNGLKKQVTDLCFQVSKACEGFDMRLTELENFAWFRDLATQVRDRWFRYGIALFVITTFFMFGMHLGDRLFQEFIKVVLSKLS